MSTTIALPNSVAADSGRRARLRLWPEWLTLFLYASLVAFAIPFHEPWADEAQAWQLAGYAPLKDLFIEHLRHEGHPGLWYVLLHVLRQFHVTYTGMHWAIAAIALVSVWLLIFWSPFPFLVRATLPFTFFLAYQYTVVARSYVLAPLLLFALAITWRRSSAIIPALLLGLLANVALQGTAVSLGFACVYAIELRNGTRKARHRTWAIALYTILFVTAALSVLPQPKDLVGPSIPEHMSAAMIATIWLLSSIIYLGRGLISLPWYLGLAMLCAAIWSVWRATPARYAIPLLMLAAFSGYFFNFWHLGFVPITCTTICWMAWPFRFRTSNALVAGIFVVSLAIGMQIAYTVYAVVYDYRNPYSPDLAASRYLAPFVAARTPIAVSYVKHMNIGAYDSVGLRPYIGGSIFLNEKEPFWRWSDTVHSRAEFQSALRQHPPIILVEYYDNEFNPFDLQRESKSRTITQIEQDGYALTHTFCGAKPEDFREREHTCHLIFESSSPPTARGDQ